MLRRARIPLIALGVLALLAYVAATTQGGFVDPTEAPGQLGRTTVVVNSALLVFREGLEAILVLAAVTAGMKGARGALRKPIALGSGVAFLAAIATWFLAIGIIGALGGPGLDVQAATGLLAVVVLLVVMNWFFHKVYWTGWISHHTKRRKALEAGGRGAVLGLVLLGFTAVYREGFEIVLFLQNLRLQAGDAVVLEGVAFGLALTAVVGAFTFVLNRKLPYKKMLVATGVLLGMVLIVMVGESMQELQLAGWVPTTDIGVSFPGWIGTWFAIFPTVETLAAQAAAALLVLGSYFLAEEMRVKRPRRRRASGAELAPQRLDGALTGPRLDGPAGRAA